MRDLFLEPERLALHRRLDAAKTQEERNRMGQFATPSDLAAEMVRHAAEIWPGGKLRFLEPGFGTGAFTSAVLGRFEPGQIDRMTGYEIDPHYAEPAQRFWAPHQVRVLCEDFSDILPDKPSANLILCNPPYVRHHYLADKPRLKAAARQAAGMELGGLASFYCYFLALAHPWMEPGALAGWLVPSGFMDVNYGKPVKKYLTERVTLVSVHRFDPNEVQFPDALVSSAVLFFRNQPPPADHKVLFSYGGTLDAPRLSTRVSLADLKTQSKWTRFPEPPGAAPVEGPALGDLFRIRRGLATGDNDFFILDAAQIKARGLEPSWFRPILPSPRALPENEINADARGLPRIANPRFLLDVRQPPEVVRERYPKLWTYLEKGMEEGVHEGYLCRHRPLWYVQEDLAPPPFLCTYMGRQDVRSGRPFRFLLNHSKAIAANTYLMIYPRDDLAAAMERDKGLSFRVWQHLNLIDPATLLGESRVYGGGLHKLEPKELKQVPARDIAEMIRPADDLFARP